MKYIFNPFTGKLGMVTNKASEISIADTGNYYTGTEVEAALAEIGAGITLDARYLKIETAENTYVPYTGANQDVNLGSKNLTTAGVIGVTGKIGVGTTNPDKKLDVDGDIRADNYTGSDRYAFMLS